MSAFGDRALLALSDPVALGALLSPTGGSGDQRVRTMLASVYDLSAVRLDTITGARVREIALQRPLFPTGRQDGAWSQLVPSYTRTELTLTVPEPTRPVWIDLRAAIDVTLVAEIDPAGAESVVSRAFDDFATFDEFRARFTFFDLDAFLAEHGISTVEELKDAFDYVVAEIQLRTPPPFDPDDPANTHTLPVTLAAVVVDPFDLAGGLRATRLVREAARPLTGPVPAGLPAEATEAYATALVIAADGLPDGLAAADVERLCAAEGVVSLFLPAP
ncbi:hypothetical protein OG496_47035 [Streptomyces sp. NBC_00988]|uniref:hypothetical protein n=1 Tax=Streptomyces sp. NBC_00988 TaxID=2903704 RepID=UPI00386E6908|nr:hypothetical protein OG496_47035 [Streptomyces sp. NBC_00988]